VPRVRRCSARRPFDSAERLFRSAGAYEGDDGLAIGRIFDLHELIEQLEHRLTDARQVAYRQRLSFCAA
jgi:hypothetical protein